MHTSLPRRALRAVLTGRAVHVLFLLALSTGTVLAAPASSPGGDTATGPQGPPPRPAAPLTAGEHTANQLLVRFRAGTSAAAMADAHAQARAREERVLPHIDVHVVTVEPAHLQHALDHYRSQRAVDYVEPNYVVHSSGVPNDPLFPQQWALQKINAPAAWDVQQGSSSVVIGVVDTGIDPLHPDLSGKLVSGWNYDSASANYASNRTADDNGHGTHVAGIAGASTNNGVGIAGVGYATSLMPIKVLDSSGSGKMDAVANGIMYAADHGARIANLSFGGPAYSQAVQDAVNYAYFAGVLVVAAAGNSGDSTAQYPAADMNVMAVAATDSADQRASFSTYGSNIAVAAPGVNILSTYWTATGGSTYATLSGTSMAAPHVSGLAGLLFAQNTLRTNDDVQNLIQRSADDVMAPGWDVYTGFGRINMYRAVIGAIVGRVTDALNGAAVRGATIQATRNSSVVAWTTSAPDGTYQLIGLAAGTYSVTTSASGYALSTTSGVAVNNGQDTTINVTLTR